MSARTVMAFVITCDARRCTAGTGIHPTEHAAWVEWRIEHEGMLFCAGIYDSGPEPREYRCGKHWHIDEHGYYRKGASHASSKAA